MVILQTNAAYLIEGVTRAKVNDAPRTTNTGSTD